jgi:predicted PolB exonuclease-like 3'-5' exonuclease
MNVLVFDIETVPDVEGGRRLYGLEDLADEDVAKAMVALQMQKKGTDFLPLHEHRIVAISAVLRSRDRLKVWSLGELDSQEDELVRRFFEGLERFSPTLVSWNGSGFDLPVLHYRALRHGVAARRYWEVGDEDREFRYNNYLGRFHWRHLDLMDVLAGYQQRAAAPLDEVASLLGFPGKMGMSGAKVWETYLTGDIEAIRDYCETDVLNTYLVYLRFELTRGHLAPSEYQAECDRVREMLAQEGSERPHLAQFLAAWQGGSASG